jgi:hypothetical protein
MRHSVLVLAALALAVLACNIMPGIPATPTLIPTVYTPPPTETETPEPPTPTLIPRSTVPVIELPPTSTAVRLGPRTGGNSGGSGNPAIGATPVTLDNGGVFIGTTVNIAGSSLQLPGGTGPIPLDFDINDGGHKAVISGTGNMTIDGVPYNANGKQVGKRFSLARWSPDGRWLAYVVETPNAESGTLGAGATIDDGLWLLDSASNAPPEFIYRHHYGGAQDTDVRIVTDINWAWDNDAMMLTVKQPRGIGMILVGKGVRANDHNPGLFDLLLYTGGTWLPDSTQGMVTTTTADNRATVMGILHRDVGQFTPIADGGALGLYIQSPTQLPDGRYAFLAKPAPPGAAQNSGLALYVMSPGGQPAAVSQPLPGVLLGATWSPSRSALLVTLGVGSDFQTKVITLDGAITDYTAAARGSASAHWGK